MWAGTTTVKVGDLHLGVRSNTPVMHALLERALADHVVEGIEAPANFTVLVADGGGHSSGGKGFHFLYADATAVVRTRDPDRLVRALLAHLSAHQPHEAAGLLRLHGRAFVKDGRALLAPGVVGTWLPVVERRLNVRGVQVVDGPWMTIRPDSSELIVPEPSLTVDWSALDGLALLPGTGGRPDPGAAYGSYPATSWAFAAPDLPGPLSRASAVLRAMRLVLNGDEVGARPALDGLVTMMRHVRPVGITWTNERELVSALVALL